MKFDQIQYLSLVCVLIGQMVIVMHGGGEEVVTLEQLL